MIFREVSNDRRSTIEAVRLADRSTALVKNDESFRPPFWKRRAPDEGVEPSSLHKASRFFDEIGVFAPMAVSDSLSMREKTQISPCRMAGGYRSKRPL